MVQNIADLIKEHDKKRTLNFYAEVPCPMKQRLRSAYDAFEKQYYERTGEKLYSFVPTNCPESLNNLGTIRSIKDAESLEDIPDVTITFGMEDFITPNIVDNYIKTGCFQKINDVEGLPFLNAEEFKDPYGCYNSVGMFPEVMLVDIKKLDGRPVPDSWEALLDPVYQGCLAVPDGHENVDAMIMAYILRRFGEGALDSFEKNLSMTHGGAASVRFAGTGKSEGAAVYILPWIFAQGAVKKGVVEVVWPKEGAVAEPIVAMVKKDCPPGSRALVDFVLSEDFSSALADNYFISTKPGADNKMPEGGKVTWLGWDYVLHNDIGALYSGLAERFSRFHKDKRKTSV